MSLTPGTPAPDFTLYDTNKQPLTLSSLRGQNVLLLFVPAAFTSTCTKEFCTMRDNIADYNNMNCKVIGITTDSVYVLIHWKAEQNLNFTLLSDYNKEVSALYDTAYAEFNFGMRGTSKRSAFVIDKEGILRYIEVLDNSGALPDFEKINEVLVKLN